MVRPEERLHALLMELHDDNAYPLSLSREEWLKSPDAARTQGREILLEEYLDIVNQELEDVLGASAGPDDLLVMVRTSKGYAIGSNTAGAYLERIEAARSEVSRGCNFVTGPNLQAIMLAEPHHYIRLPNPRQCEFTASDIYLIIQMAYDGFEHQADFQTACDRGDFGKARELLDGWRQVLNERDELAAARTTLPNLDAWESATTGSEENDCQDYPEYDTDNHDDQYWEDADADELRLLQSENAPDTAWEYDHLGEGSLKDFRSWR
jgi:hypothetical protein